MPTMIRTLSILAAAALAMAACSRGGDAGQKELVEALAEANAEAAPPARGEGILGYNEPLVWDHEIGVRAVARGPILAISVRNRRSESIFVGPDQFRLVFPQRELYAFERDRDDLSGFPVRELRPGQAEVFAVRVPARGDLTGRGLVFQYPPAEALARLVIEPAGSLEIKVKDVAPE